MNIKSILVIVLSGFIASAFYSSSASLVFAEIKTSCMGTSKTTQVCTTFDTETGDNDSWKCTKNKDGKTWSCKKAQTMTASTVSPELNDALDIAVEETQQTTKVPKDLGGLRNNEEMKINPGLE